MSVFGLFLAYRRSCRLHGAPGIQPVILATRRGELLPRRLSSFSTNVESNGKPVQLRRQFCVPGVPLIAITINADKGSHRVMAANGSRNDVLVRVVGIAYLFAAKRTDGSDVLMKSSIHDAASMRPYSAGLLLRRLQLAIPAHASDDAPFSNRYDTRCVSGNLGAAARWAT